MNTSYTSDLEENLWGFAYSIDESSEADEHYAIINYLNSSDKFRSFGDGLLSVVQSKYPIEEIDKTTVSVF